MPWQIQVFEKPNTIYLSSSHLFWIETDNEMNEVKKITAY